MSTFLKRFALPAAAVSALVVGAMTTMTVPASAHVVCDDDGDDCWRTHPYWDRDEDRDWHHYRHERREWEERRARDAYRDWYWSRQPYYYGYPAYSGGSVWFNF